jgi:hypothetical protein
VAVAHTPFDEANARFSPDGRWVTYESNETGRLEIYVQPFPGPGDKLPVSNGGGGSAQWRRDGRELFYVSADNRLMSVPVSSAGPTFHDKPVPLFTLPPQSEYAPSADGQRFLINKITEDASPITVLLNWKPR